MDILSWIASGFTLISVYLIGKKLPIAQLIGLFGCILWIVAMWTVNIPQVILNFIFIVIYFKNYLIWRKK